MRYRDVLIRIDPAQDGVHPVLALSRQVERWGTFRIPFAAGEVVPAPRLRVGRDLTSSEPTFRLHPEAAGDRLFRALFHGPVGDLLRAHLDRTDGPTDLGVRVRIHFQLAGGGSALHNLPWELLYCWERRAFLGLSRKSPIVRSLPAFRPVSRLRGDSPLRILVAVGKLPAGAAQLAFAEETKILDEARSSGVDVVFHEISSALDFYVALQKGDFHVLHYMGHGGFDAALGIGALLLGEAHGEVTGPFVAQAVRDLPHLRLVVLNACQTGRFASETELDPYTGIAPALLLAGVPAVLAMRSRISDAAAVAFSRSFYSHLAAGDPVEAAVSEARKFIQASWPGTFEWTTPVLFLQSHTGRLLPPSQEARNGRTSDLPKIYLQWMTEKLREIQPPAAHREGRLPAIDLESVFMPLSCRPVHPATLARMPGLFSEIPFPPFATERHVVLLGEAGSGKTTLLQWLAKAHAHARLVRKLAVSAPGGAELGRTRVPVLVSLDEFAKARRQSDALSLTRFLGHHLAPGNSALDAGRGALLPFDALQAWFIHLLKADGALILMDGLDEITDPYERYEVAREVDRFRRDWLPSETTASSNRTGGLRMVVTSRLAGYQAAPLGQDFTHWLLEPMDPPSARLFGTAWERALREQEESSMPDPSPVLGPEALLSNPRLATMLAVLRLRSPETHPQRRVDLFSAAVSLLLEDWRKRAGLDGEKLLAIVAEWAAIQTDSADSKSLETFLRGHLLAREAERAHAALRDQGEHGLLHSAFREYLAARWLAQDRMLVPGRILERLGAPRWGDSLRMALGWMSVDWSPLDLVGTLRALLEAADPLGALLPRVPALIVASLAEMAAAPAEVVEEVASRLIAAWASRSCAGGPPALLELIERTFLRLVESAPAEPVDRALCRALRGDPQAPCLAAAHFVHVAKRGTAELAAALDVALPRDSEEHGWPVDAALRQIAARQPDLLPARPGTFRLALRRDSLLLQRFRGSPGWRRIGLALYGNSSEPAGMVRDSPLTPLLVAALQADRSCEALAADLWNAVTDSSAEVRADALLALAALGEPVAARLRIGDAAARQALSRISRLARLLEIALPQAVHSLPPDLEYDLVAATLGVVLTLGGSPLTILPLAEGSPPETRPRLLSEVLHGVLAGVHGDPSYNLAVLLDTAGETLASPPTLLARTLAVAAKSVNANWSGHRAWSLDRLASDNDDDIGVLTQALDALDGLADPFDFFRGWALTVLASTLREAGLVPEALGFALGQLFDRFDSRPDALRALAGTASPSVSTLVAAARQIDDPCLRFRALLRLAKSFPDLHKDLLSAPPLRGFQRLLARLRGTGDSVLANQARAIAEPSRRSTAFLGLAILDPSGRARWTSAAWRAAKRIDDPDGRARALAKLAPLLPHQKRNRCLAAALGAATGVVDEARRAETLYALSPSLAAFPRLRGRCERIAAELHAPKDSARASGLASPILLSAENEIGQESTLIVLGAIVNDLHRELFLPKDVSRLWATLAEPGGRSAALECLLRLGRLQGLRLTADAAMVLDSLIEAGDLKAVTALLPWLESPEPAASPILERWLAGSSPQARSHSALLLAEQNGLTAGPLSNLLELLEEPDDRTRHRAALALHGDLTPGSRPLAVSRLGPAVLEELARRWLSLRNHAPGPTKVIQWTFQQIDHDNGDALTRWARQNDEGSEVILGTMEWLHSTAEAAFLSLLREGPLRVQQALIRSLCRLLAHERIQANLWDEIVPLLRNLTPEAGKDSFLADPPPALLGAVRDAWEESGKALSPSLPAVAERALASRVQLLSTAFQSDPSTAREILRAAGRASRPDGRSVRTAGERIATNPELMLPLLAWLCARLGSDLQDVEPFRPVTSDLLTLAAATAERQPPAYLTAIRQLPDLLLRLRQAARFHDSFPGRKAALLLLALPGRLTLEMLDILEGSLWDVAPVQSAVLDSLGLYREADREVLPRLFQDLSHPIPMTALASSRLLAALARGGSLPSAEREEVIRALSEAATAPGSLRDVYVMSEIPPLRIETNGRLDEALYGALAEISGLNDLLGFKPGDPPEERA